MAKKPKKPKAPKASASYQTWQNYWKRLTAWKAEVRRIEAEKKKKAQLIQKARSFR